MGGASRLAVRPTARGWQALLVGLHAANEERLLAARSADERGHLAAALRTLLESLGDTTLGSPSGER